MQPFELAQQLRESASSDTIERFESADLTALLDNSEIVRNHLIQVKYAANEYGHVEFAIFDWENHFNKVDHVDAIETVFVDPTGLRIRLGSVMRLQKRPAAIARAYLHPSDTSGLPIGPEDERWEAIVGVLESAIGDCQTLKRASVLG